MSIHRRPSFRMYRRQHNRRMIPVLNTASLPDLIFTVLFFFMIVTHMRDDNMQVKYTLPKGDQLSSQQKHPDIVDIYVGKAMPQSGSDVGDGYMLQVNSEIVDINTLGQILMNAKQKAEAAGMSSVRVNFCADRDVPMSMISEIKRVMRRCDALEVSYTAMPAKSSQSASQGK